MKGTDREMILLKEGEGRRNENWLFRWEWAVVSQRQCTCSVLLTAVDLVRNCYYFLSPMI